MSVLTLYTRSFHPDEAFGGGGLGFKGDNRGFSASEGATARIYHFIAIDLKAATLGKVVCDSEPSSNWFLKEYADIDMSNDYSQARKKPRHNESGNVTPYREDGEQAVNLRISYAGKNFAFFGADEAPEFLQKAGVEDLHYVYGGQVSDGGSNTKDGTFFPFEVQSPVSFEDDVKIRSPIEYTGEKWSGAVPDLDAVNHVTLQIDRVKRKANVSCSITGDGFPNCESFIIDSAGNVLFLATHVRVGTAMTQLPGNRQIAMGRAMLDVDWNPDDSFGAQVTVHIAHDFTGVGSPKEIASGSMARTAWNAAHTGRDASGPLSRQIRDNFPLPQSETFDDAADWLGKKLGM